MNGAPQTNPTTLLQKGIAAARAGRSDEALQLLGQVVKIDAVNEMAWLWLSGLMTTHEQKRACLERVLSANPRNAYAQVGLKRLQDVSPPSPPSAEAGIIEARLAAVTVGRTASSQAATPPQGTQLQGQPVIKRLTSTQLPARSRTGGPIEDSATIQPTFPSPPLPSNPPDTGATIPSNGLETTCPACDERVSLTDSRCSHCFMPFSLFKGGWFPMTGIAP